MNCLLFDRPEEAFATVLKGDPLVVAVGETHAQVDGAEAESTTSRFTELLLPTLKDKASDVVLELMQRSGDCVEKEEKVAKKQEPVKQTQKKSNQSEFLALGNKAQSLGIRPHILRPSCEDFDAVIAAGDSAVIVMLEMIARLTSKMVKAILERNERQGDEKIVVAYTGIVHNDLVPREGRERWSFGPDLFSHVAGRYVEIDLIVPEFVKSGPPWDSLVWTKHFDKTRHADKTKLYNPRPGSYVLIFPASPETVPKADTGR